MDSAERTAAQLRDDAKYLRSFYDEAKWWRIADRMNEAADEIDRLREIAKTLGWKMLDAPAADAEANVSAGVELATAAKAAESEKAAGPPRFAGSVEQRYPLDPLRRWWRRTFGYMWERLTWLTCRARSASAAKRREALVRIRENAEARHGDDAAKGRALAVIAGWAKEALGE